MGARRYESLTDFALPNYNQPPHQVRATIASWRLGLFFEIFIEERTYFGEILLTFRSVWSDCPSNTMRSATTPAARSLRCARTVLLRKRSRVPEP
jgi:hypothetical protein